MVYSPWTTRPPGRETYPNSERDYHSLHLIHLIFHSLHPSDNNGKARSIETYHPGISILTYPSLLEFMEQRMQISDKVVRILGQVCPPFTSLTRKVYFY